MKNTFELDRFKVQDLSLYLFIFKNDFLPPEIREAITKIELVFVFLVLLGIAIEVHMTSQFDLCLALFDMR